MRKYTVTYTKDSQIINGENIQAQDATQTIYADGFFIRGYSNNVCLFYKNRGILRPKQFVASFHEVLSVVDEMAHRECYSEQIS